MSDRELLEFAAKAAEYVLTDGSQGYRTFRCKGGVEWNPLTDDGDALRLAVKLCIEISPCPECDSVACEPKGRPDSVITTEALDDYGVRRAIVRAAAEIGRSMR